MPQEKQYIDTSRPEFAELMRDIAPPAETAEPQAPEPVVETVPAVEPVEAPAEVVAAPTDKAEEAEKPEADAEQEKPAQEEVSETDILKAALDAAEARAKHNERVAGGLGGKVGFLEQRVKELTELVTTAPRRSASEDEADVAADSDYTEHPRRERAPAAPDPMKVYVAKKAGEEAVIAFAKAHPDFNDVDSGMKDAFEKYAPEGFDLDAMARNARDPMALQQEIAGSLETAYWRASADVKAARVKTLTERKATQVANLVRDKQKASGSASGSTPAPRPPAKTIDQMTRAEIGARLREMTS